MDYKTQLVTGIYCIVFGVYILLIGYRTAILREKVLTFIVHFMIWLNRLVNGNEAAEKFRAQKMEPKHLYYNGISYLLIGAITLILGILLLIEL